MQILYLDVLNPFEPAPLQRLADIAERDYSARFMFLRAAVEALPSLTQAVEDAIDEADAFVLRADTLLHGPRFSRAVHERIAGGRRALLQFGPAVTADSDGLVAQFGAKYDLTPTDVTIATDDTECGHPRLVRIRRSGENFRDPQLFRGVNEVWIQQPTAIWHGGDSLPVLVPGPTEYGVDARTDFPVTWGPRELAVMAAWYGDNDAAVLAIGGGLLHDPYRGPFGHDFPGIEANGRLASNLLHFLLPTTPKRELAPFEAVNRIEINLADVVLTVLRGTGAKWWESHVPADIRKRCEGRKRNSITQAPPEAFLDFGDYAKLLDTHATHFAGFLAAGGPGATPSAWAERLNQLRNVIMHPTKRHVGGCRLTDADMRFLRDTDYAFRRIARNLKNRHEQTVSEAEVAP